MVCRLDARDGEPRKTTRRPRDAKTSGGICDEAACTGFAVLPKQARDSPSSLCMSANSRSSGRCSRLGDGVSAQSVLQCPSRSAL